MEDNNLAFLNILIITVRQRKAGEPTQIVLQCKFTSQQLHSIAKIQITQTRRLVVLPEQLQVMEKTLR